MSTVTFLFTDIEGSTRLWEQQPDAMQVALARHDRLLRDAIEGHHGRVVKSTGDGCHAVFETASAACAAVLAAQRALSAEGWPELLPQALRVRMALHSGEAESRAGDFFGPAVNRAARLLAIGHGGQVLVSAVTAELVRDQLPPGVSLIDLGQHQLKDLVRPEQVYQLAAPGLPGDFPALRSLGGRPHNLPVQLSSFIGRETELAEVGRWLATTHLLTLTGPGGTGKTRLALQAAAEALEAFPQGAWLVELAPLSDPALLPQTLATALGVREQLGQPLLEALQDYLRSKHLLLVLDNCEHLIAAGAQLATRLLQACPQLTILATSREALGLPGETIYRVPSLALADSRTATPEALAQSEAVRLFVERAQAVQPRFQLTEHNLHAVAQICERLDGIPLAIELAAARLKLLSADQIAERLDDRFRLLTGGSRTALPRQQTLRALIDWSCDLLSEPERAAWRQLSVFAGGFTLEAAEAVLGPEALDWLAHLVDKSLVIMEPDETGGEPRYRLLETIRQYGRDQLVAAGEASGARDRHLAYYRQYALDIEPRLSGPDLLPALNRLQLEHDNFRAALEWALARDPEAAVQIAASLNHFWSIRGYRAEGSQWLRDSLARLGSLPRAGQGLRAKGLSTLGSLAFGQGELHAARSYLEESVLLARQADDRRCLGQSLAMLSLTLVWLGDEAALAPVLAEGQAVAQEEDREARALLSSARAQQAFRQQDLVTAESGVEAANALSRQAGSPWYIAITLMGLAAFKGQQGHRAEARVHLAEAEQLFGALGDRGMAISMQSERAHLERRAGDYALAKTIYCRAIAAYQELGLRGAVLHGLECLAFIAIAERQAARAALLLGAAEAWREGLKIPMTALERDEYDRQVARLQTEAEGETVSSAWAEGRALSLEAAVAQALTLAE